MIGRIIGGGISCLVGFSLFPTIKEQVTIASANVTSTTPTYTLIMLNYVPYFFLGAVVLMTIGSLIPDLFPSEEYREDYEEDLPNHKQTYEEYVRERLRVERMMRYGWIGRYL